MAHGRQAPATDVRQANATWGSAPRRHRAKAPLSRPLALTDFGNQAKRQPPLAHPTAAQSNAATGRGYAPATTTLSLQLRLQQHLHAVLASPTPLRTAMRHVPAMHTGPGRHPGLAAPGAAPCRSHVKHASSVIALGAAPQHAASPPHVHTGQPG